MILFSTIEQDTYAHTESLSSVDNCTRCDQCSETFDDFYEVFEHKGETMRFCTESCVIEYAVENDCIEAFYGTGATEEEVRAGTL